MKLGALLKNFQTYNSLIDEFSSLNDFYEKHDSVFDKLIDALKEEFEAKTNLPFNFAIIVRNNDLFLYKKLSNEINITISSLEFTIDDFNSLLLGEFDLLSFIGHVCKTNINPNFDIHQDNFKQIGKSWEKYLSRTNFSDDIIVPEEAEIVNSELKNSKIIWCHNKSCTGKTFLAIHCLNSLTTKKLVYNPQFKGSISLNLLLLIIKYGSNASILIDDLQGNIDDADQIITILRQVQGNLLERNLHVYMVSWTDLPVSYKSFIQLDSVYSFSLKPSKFTYLLKNRIPQKILSLLDEELLNSLVIINYLRQISPSFDDSKEALETKLFNAIVKSNDISKDMIKALYVISILGSFEFDCDLHFLRRYSKINIDEILKSISTSKLIASSIFIGHREICRYISYYIEKNYAIEYQKESVILDYFNVIPHKQKWRTLYQIIGQDKTTDVGKLGNLWKLLTDFEKAIRIENQKDPSWENTPSSMYFVLSAANLLGVTSEYKTVLTSYVKNINLNNDFLEYNLDRLKTTYDFKRIKQEMILQDETQNFSSFESGITVDENLMHTNWLLGLTAGLYEELQFFNFNEVHTATVNTIEKNQLEIGGWYPLRVPWVTARILIGLAKSGYSKESEIVKKGINFLIQHLQDKDYWTGGTGKWNTNYEVTALSLKALHDSGFDIKSNDKTARALLYLCNNNDEWMSRENEIDGSATASLIAKLNGIDKNLLDYIEQLMQRNVQNIISRTKNLDYENLQSCNSTQIGFFIMDLCWYVLKRDISTLLKIYLKRSKSEKKMKRVFISYSYDNENHIKRVKRIADHLKENNFEVLFDQYEEYGNDLDRFMDLIPSSDVILLIGTTGYKQKVLAGKGGVSYEKSLLSLVKIKGNSHKIVPVVIGNDFESAIPDAFALNKALYFNRITEKSIKKIETAIREKR